ncbi:MAG: LLM class flavin-dependent oxidoreductase [Micromonosporaceae bacterium]|jgi:alkanesulfonate monooxygenase SsuD/methylene tetrahydromethanopterin reductase-like flavin-dependent oxidoreductase (luciferase family)|nr:LLM class flavin-dependent oxidoreductase [Micromonosporaceae bacterium]
MTAKLGVQITPWSTSRELVELGRRLSAAVDLVWVQDQMLARNVYALLAALAQAGCGVGTNVTYPIGRNPIEMAAAAATIGELIPGDREMVVGMGTGGALVNSLFRKDRPLSAVREAITLMRALWTGDPVPLNDFAALGSALGYREGATAQLTFPVVRRPDIVVAGVGPKILSIAATHADGLISPSNMPTLCRAALRSGRFGEISGLDAALAARPAGLPPLRLIFGINVSISKDRDRARAHARRQVSLVIGNPRLWPDLAAVGLDVESAEEVKAAFDRGLGVQGAAARCSDSLADALIISGTPEECVEPMIELRDLAARHGYQEFYVGAPLGPDPAEAADLLLTRVIPEVWPERRGGR